METSYNIIIINNRQKLAKLDLLEKDALVNEKSRTYCIGFDAEFISKATYPYSFNKCRNWIIDTPTNEAVCLIQIASKKYVFLLENFESPVKLIYLQLSHFQKINNLGNLKKPFCDCAPAMYS